MSRALVLSALVLLATACAAETEGDPAEETGEPSALTASGFTTPSLSPDERDAVLAKYTHVDPDHVIDKDLLHTALVGFDVNKDALSNKHYMGVVDFSLPSGKKRFFVVDLESGDVEAHVVAHGSGSDPGDSGYAKKFSNVVNSNASSLGFYATAEIYSGAHGRSLRLDGLSPTDSRVRARNVVIHGAAYVSSGRAKQGRSNGCLALPTSEKDEIIDKLKGEALIYAGN
jgi:hypothetical protein